MSAEWILHIALRSDWDHAQSSGEYRSSSLDSEGFIHCSTPAQVLRSANRFFTPEQDLVLLWIDPQKTRPEIRWEFNDGQDYPHIYGPLNLDAVAQADAFPPGPAGTFTDIPPSP